MDQPKTFKIDACYKSEEELAILAAKMEHITPEFQAWLEASMENTESRTFYLGLMAGYAGAFALMQQVPVSDITVTAEKITAFLASKVRKMKSIELPKDTN